MRRQPAQFLIDIDWQSEVDLVWEACAAMGVPVTAVVRLLGVPKSTITSLLKRLERDGLIHRGQNPQDARSQLLFVTEKGAQTGKAAQERVKALERRLQARVSNADMRALARIVDAVTAETGINLPAENVPRKARGGRK